MKLHLLLPILLLVAGCTGLTLSDGSVILPEDVIDQAVTTLTPLASLVPYGSALVAALLTGTGLYRKYKPSIVALEEIVNTVENLPDEAKAVFKSNMDVVASAQTNKVITSIKS